VRVEVPLRWGDLDAQGHVNNARYIDYLQDARADFLYELGIDHLLREGFTVVSNQIEYREPVFFSLRPMLVDITVAEVDTDAVCLAYQLYQDANLVAQARTTLSAYDLATRQRRPLSDQVRDIFAAIQEPAPALRQVAWVEMDRHAKVSSMRVRWSDMDAYGHVNNAIIFDYLQEGRIMFTAAPLRGMGATPNVDYLWFLARQDVSYRYPVVFRKEPYDVLTGVARLGRSSMTISSQVNDPTTATVCAQAAAVVVLADARGEPTALPEPLKAQLSRYLLSGGPPGRAAMASISTRAALGSPATATVERAGGAAESRRAA
jgi:acyl-CoA thioester hydrolase